MEQPFSVVRCRAVDGFRRHAVFPERLRFGQLLPGGAGLEKFLIRVYRQLSALVLPVQPCVLFVGIDDLLAGGFKHSCAQLAVRFNAVDDGRHKVTHRELFQPGQVGHRLDVVPLRADAQILRAAETVLCCAAEDEVYHLDAGKLCRCCEVVVLQLLQFSIPQILSALQNVHPLQPVVVVLVILNGVDEHALGQVVLYIVGYGEILGCIAEGDPQLAAALVGLPDAAAKGQRYREDAPSAGREHPLQLGVDPVGTAAAFHRGFQLQRGQPCQLCTDQRRQVQRQCLRVLIQRQTVDGCIVPVLNGPLHPVGDKGLAADDVLNVGVVYHAFCTPLFCQTSSRAYLVISML